MYDNTDANNDDEPATKPKNDGQSTTSKPFKAGEPYQGLTKRRSSFSQLFKKVQELY
jgi:hypothetical protein